jgi:hypothetical protein
MFCNRCGTEMQASSAACPNCGRRMADALREVAQGGRLERHLPILGVLWMVIGGLFLIPAAGLMVFGGGIRLMLHARGPWPGLFQLLLFVAGGSFTILAAGGVCVGLDLMQRASWARTAAIILGILALFHPPFGTALGVYSLWVLLAAESGDEYQCLARASRGWRLFGGRRNSGDVLEENPGL